MVVYYLRAFLASAIAPLTAALAAAVSYEN